MRCLTGLLLSVVLLPCAGQAATAKRAPFGQLPDGRKVEVITLTNARGMTARILSYGGILQALEVPDAKGRKADVVEGYASLDGYLAKPNYFGATVGRYANRIAGASFSLDGKTYTLAKNDGPNTLHGGLKGFDKQLWSVAAIKSGRKASVTLRLRSPDGDEGYPGSLQVTTTYTLDEAGELAIDYRATTDRSTIINMTGHAYFNLAGEGSGRSILDHVLTIPAERYTPINATLIPTGQIAPVAGTVFDFRKPTSIGARIGVNEEQLRLARGYDHNWVLPAVKPGAARFRLAAKVKDPASGRVLEVWSDQPGVQFYSGNFLDGTIVGKGGKPYRQRDAFCIEPQLFPDTPNQPAFGSARLDPGQTYHHHLAYRFSAAAAR